MNKWLNQKIVCNCGKADKKKIAAIKGEVLLGSVLQVMIAIGFAVTGVFSLKEAEKTPFYIVLVLATLLVAYDVISFWRMFYKYTKNGHTVSCAKRLSFVHVFKSNPIA